MNIPPSQRLQAIALASLIVVVGIFAWFRIADSLAARNADSAGTQAAQQSPSPSNPSLPAGSSGAMNVAQNSTTASGGTRLPTAADMEEETSAPVPPIGRDPFKPPHGSPIPASSNSQSAVQRAPSTAGHTRPLNITRRDASPILPGFRNRGIGEIGMQPAQPAPPPVELKGVIAGDPPLAIVSVGGETSVRREGEQIAPGILISRITEAGVVLRQGRRNILVNVGHTVEPPAEGASGAGLRTAPAKDSGVHSSSPLRQPAPNPAPPVGKSPGSGPSVHTATQTVAATQDAQVSNSAPAKPRHEKRNYPRRGVRRAQAATRPVPASAPAATASQVRIASSGGTRHTVKRRIHRRRAATTQTAFIGRRL